MGGSIGVINNTEFTLKIELSNGGTTYYESDEVRPKQIFYRDTGRVWFDLIAYPYKFGDYLEDEDGAAREDDHKVLNVTWGQFQDIHDIDNPESTSKPGDNKEIHIAKKTYDKITSAFAEKQPSNLSKAFDEIGWKLDDKTIASMCNDEKAKGNAVDYVKKSAMIAIQYSKMYDYEPNVYASGGKGKWYMIEGLPTGDGKRVRTNGIKLTYVESDTAINSYVEIPDYTFTDYSYKEYYDKEKE